MLGFGVTVPWGTCNTLDFGYRSLNGGEVRTDVGNIDVVPPAAATSPFPSTARRRISARTCSP